MPFGKSGKKTSGGENNVKLREHWSGRLAFVLAASGSAVGLGNLWKFPYITWQNGGGLFVLFYLLCIVLVGLPIMISEITIGKMTQKDPVGAFRALGGNHTPFRFVGLLGVLSGFVVLSYYSVVAGWSIEYSIKSLSNDFSKIPQAQVTQLLNKEENRKKLAAAAFNEALKKPVPDERKAQMLSDAGLLENINAGGPVINKVFSENRDDLSQELQKNNRLEYYRNLFLNERKNAENYNTWQNEKLMPAYSTGMFVEFITDPVRTMSWHTVFMILSIVIVIGGIKGGIEKAVRFFMPILFILMIIMVVNSLMLDKEQEGVRFLLKGDSSKFTPKSVLDALGHAFFTLSLGLGAIMTYGSYLNKKDDAIVNSLWVTGMDTGIAFLATLMIFPIIFVYGLEPAGGGLGILFTTLPLELMKFPTGQLLTVLFYVLVFLAAFTSGISLLEVVVTYLVDEKGLSRFKATLIAGAAVYIAGVPSAIDTGSFLDYADKTATGIMLPLGGLFIALFAGWRIKTGLLKDEFIKHGYPMWSFNLFRFSIKFLTPTLVTVVFIYTVYSYI